MTRVIWKYDLTDTGRLPIDMPEGAELLSAGVQDGKVVLWALVDPNTQKAERHILVVGTGWDLGDDFDECRYVSTLQTGYLVFHVFDDGER